MYNINKLERPVLIMPDEVLFHAATDHKVDERQILQNIIIAEERFIAPAMCDDFYFNFIEAKNRTVDASNQSSILTDINAYRTARDKEPITVTDIPIGTYINSPLFLNADMKLLWNMYLWKLTAEAVDQVCTVPSWLRHNSKGQQKNNPEGLMSNGGESASGDLKDISYKSKKQIQDRIDPLIERMRLWICKNKEKYQDYCKTCCCEDGADGVSSLRKTNWVFNAYDKKNCERSNCNCSEH